MAQAKKKVEEKTLDTGKVEVELLVNYGFCKPGSTRMVTRDQANVLVSKNIAKMIK